VVDGLQRFSCTPEHRTIRLAIYRMSWVRGKRITAQLSALRARGCDVRAIYSIGGAKPIMLYGPQLLTSAGVSTTCVYLMHDKFVYLDVVDRTTGAPRRVLWSGSQNLADGSIASNDDALLSLTAELAKGSWSSDIRSLSGWYLNRWNRMAAHPTSCVWHT
jgi:PLD-like domain